jgi:hypothetical protein
MTRGDAVASHCYTCSFLTFIVHLARHFVGFHLFQYVSDTGVASNVFFSRLAAKPPATHNATFNSSYSHPSGDLSLGAIGLAFYQDLLPRMAILLSKPNRILASSSTTIGP